MRIALLLATALVLSTQMAVASPPEAEIKALDQKFVEAFNKLDIDALTAYYAEDAVTMDPGPALWHKGVKNIRAAWTEMVATMESPKLTIRDTHYRAAGTLGYSCGLYDLTFTDKASGEVIKSQGRFLSVFEKRGDQWLCVADHASAPFIPPDMGKEAQAVK